MNNILILAEGLAAKHFIERINLKRMGGNSYQVITPGEFEKPDKITEDMTFHSFDPTSLSKLRGVLHSTQFSMVFIALDSIEETKESLENIRILDEKIRVYLLDRWDAFDESDESYTRVFNINQLISNRLFDHLPNVPLTAQNVGLSEGEIMQILIPFGSSYAYRHVGSISQVKWKIVAIYREKKLILPTSATMLKPQDMIVIIGKPNILNNIYRRIANKGGLFPEPFGKNLYMVIDMEQDSEQMMNYINEAIYLQERLEGRELIVRIINPNDFVLLERIKTFDSSHIEILIDYINDDIESIMTSDNQQYNIGLIFTSLDTFTRDKLSSALSNLKKLVYIFGETPLYTIDRSIVLMSDEEEMESISSTSFYISEMLGFSLCLCNFDPEGDFESKKIIVEHYETLSHATHYPITIEEKSANPIRALSGMKNILQIASLTKGIENRSLLSLFSTQPKDYLLNSAKHPKLLIPVVLD